MSPDTADTQWPSAPTGRSREQVRPCERGGASDPLTPIGSVAQRRADGCDVVEVAVMVNEYCVVDPGHGKR